MSSIEQFLEKVDANFTFLEADTDDRLIISFGSHPRLTADQMTELRETISRRFGALSGRVVLIAGDARLEAAS